MHNYDVEIIGELIETYDTRIQRRIFKLSPIFERARISKESLARTSEE